MSTVRCRFPLTPKKGRRTRSASKAVQAARTKEPSRAARMLALAYRVERLLEAGQIESYAEAARALGLTRARLSQVMSLLLLAPEVQERLLAGEVHGTERSLRCAVREADWGSQLALCGTPSE